MLQKLNERFQGIFAWVVISLIAGTFAMFGVEHYIQSRHEAGARANVNGEPITQRDFELYYRRDQRLHDEPSLTASEDAQKKQALLEALIVKNVSLQSAESLGFDVTTPQVMAAIQTIPQFLDDGHFSTNRYQQSLSNTLFTPRSFQTEVRQEMLLNQQRYVLSGTSFALPEDVEKFVQLTMQTRNYHYLVVPFHSFEHATKPDTHAVEAYYQAHSDTFKIPEKVSVEWIDVSMKTIREKIQPTERELRTFYNENKGNYTTPAQWKVAHVLYAFPTGSSPTEQAKIEQQAIQASQLLKTEPKQFDNLVKTRSDDKISVVDSGVLPWIVAGQTEFESALKGLTVEGQLSGPVKTAHGIELFKLKAYKPAILKSFDAVKQGISDQLRLEQAQANYARDVDALSDLAYQTPDTLSPVAEALHSEAQHTTLFSKKGGDTALTKNPKVLEAAFSRDVLELGNNSEPLQLDNDTVIVLRVATHVPASIEPLATVKPAIETLLIKQKAVQEANALGEQLRALSPDSTAFKKIMTEHHLTWQTIENQRRDITKALESVNAMAFSLGHPGDLSGKALESGDFALVQLTDVSAGEMKTLKKKQLSKLTRKMQQTMGEMDYELYVQSLLKNAKIIRY